jgi:hypothetical protein
LLILDPNKRLSADEVLDHSWIQKYTESVDSSHKYDMLDANIIARLKQYRGVSHLRRACMNILVKMASEEEVC